MARPDENTQALREWLAIPERIEEVVEGLEEGALDWRAAGEGLSIRETVHHLVEANLVASNIIIAALATNGGTFDWSWVMPGGDWMKRMGYDRAPIRPAIVALRALGLYFSEVIRTVPDGFTRQVRLLDAPGAELYTKTVKEILQQEIDHAKEHLGEARRTKESHGL